MLRKSDYELAFKLARLGQRGARKAIEQAHSAGLAVPFERGDKVLWEWPDGTITDKWPEYMREPALQG